MVAFFICSLTAFGSEPVVQTGAKRLSAADPGLLKNGGDRAKSTPPQPSPASQGRGKSGGTFLLNPLLLVWWQEAQVMGVAVLDLSWGLRGLRRAEAAWAEEVPQRINLSAVIPAKAGTQ